MAYMGLHCSCSCLIELKKTMLAGFVQNLMLLLINAVFYTRFQTEVSLNIGLESTFVFSLSLGSKLLISLISCRGFPQRQV